MTRDELLKLAQRYRASAPGYSGRFDVSFTAAGLEAFAAALSCATPAGEGLTLDKAVSIIAACRDAFPEPPAGTDAEEYWSQAIGDPESVPDYLRALAASPVPIADTGAPKECHVNEFSSRMCEYGTKGCIDAHALASPPPQSAPGEAVAWLDPERGLSWLVDRMKVAPGTKLYAHSAPGEAVAWLMKGKDSVVADQVTLTKPDPSYWNASYWETVPLGPIATTHSAPQDAQPDPFNVKTRTPYEMGFADGFARAQAAPQASQSAPGEAVQCLVSPVSSRMCEQGTKGCATTHSAPQDAQPMPSHEEMAASMRTVSHGSRCPLCGWDYPHEHSPTEIIIYRNGVKYGRLSTQPWTGADDQGLAEDARHDAGEVGLADWHGADEHHEHRTGQPDADRAGAGGDREGSGVSGAREVREGVMPQASQSAPGEAVATVYRGGWGQFGHATSLVRWEKGADALSPGHHRLYTHPATTHSAPVERKTLSGFVYKEAHSAPVAGMTLTEDEIRLLSIALWEQGHISSLSRDTAVIFARAIEAALREKAGGK